MVQSDSVADRVINPSAAMPPSKHVCLHLRGSLEADVRAQRNVEALSQAGFMISLVDFDRNHSGRVEKPLKGVSIIHLNISNWSGPSSFKLGILFKYLDMIVQGTRQLLKIPADIYHAGDLRALPATYLAARLRRKPLIFETYEVPLVQPYLMKHRIGYGIAVRFLKAMIRRCDAVIATSPFHVTETQRRYGGPPAALVRNLPEYQPPVTSDRLRRFLNLGPQTRIALYQGGFQNNRALDKLIGAARFLAPGNIIVLMGRGPIQTQLEKQIMEEGVNDRVKIVPAVPYEDLLEWTASADIGLTLFDPGWSVSIQFCLPNKLFEYMMAGLPVLTSPLEAIVDIIQRYEVGRVVATLEPEAIGKAINDFLADPQSLAQMRAHALQASERELNWEIESQHLIDFYQQFAGVKA